MKLSPSGRFRVTVNAPAGVPVVYYRALTRVPKTAGNRKTFRTFTLVRGVRIAR